MINEIGKARMLDAEIYMPCIWFIAWLGTSLYRGLAKKMLIERGLRINNEGVPHNAMAYAE